MSTIKDAEGPIVIWFNGGYEGWSPKSYPDIKSALMEQECRFNSEWVLTRIINFEIIEKE